MGYDVLIEAGAGERPGPIGHRVGPVFRAEPSDTARHLASYTSLDAEMGFIEDHRDVIAAPGEPGVGLLRVRSP